MKLKEFSKPVKEKYIKSISLPQIFSEIRRNTKELDVTNHTIISRQNTLDRLTTKIIEREKYLTQIINFIDMSEDQLRFLSDLVLKNQQR